MWPRLPISIKLFKHLDLRIISSTFAARRAIASLKKNQTESQEVQSPGKNVGPGRVSREMKAYFEANQVDDIVSKFPSSFLKRTQISEQLYLFAPQLAKTIAEYVTDGLDPNKLLVEVNPGVGLLTKELLEKTNNLLLYEADERFAPDLKQLVEANRNIELRFEDFNGFWKYEFMDSIDKKGRMEKMLKGLRRAHWKDEEVNFRLFSVVGSMRFFKTLIHSMGTQKGLFELGRCEMYLAVPPLFYAHLTCPKEAGYKLYRRNSVLFQIFFEHEFIAKIPRKDFLPWPNNTTGKLKIQTQYLRLGLKGQDELYLMRVVPRKNLFDFCLPDNLKLLMFFVTQNMISRKNRIIPALERWIPYSGARLILHHNYVAPSKPTVENSPSELPTLINPSLPLRENDFPNRLTIFTEFGELTPSQILTVFNEFISWPEFQQSPFLQNSEQYYTKQVLDSKLNTATKSAEVNIEDTTTEASSGTEDLLEGEEEHVLREGSEGTKSLGIRRERR